MVFRALAAFVLFALVQSSASIATNGLTPEQGRLVMQWLSVHPGYRLATDQDCSCDEEIRATRTGYDGNAKPIPDYHPYLAIGDFNGKGHTDLAVAVVNEKDSHDFTMLVFNGPFNPAHAVPAFVDAHHDLTRMGFSFGPPLQKPYRLIVGRFESEGSELKPEGNTYRLVADTCC